MDATARAQRARPKRVGQHANVGGCMRRIRIMMRSSPERSTFFNSLLVFGGKVILYFFMLYHSPFVCRLDPASIFFRT